MNLHKVSVSIPTTETRALKAMAGITPRPKPIVLGEKKLRQNEETQLTRVIIINPFFFLTFSCGINSVSVACLHVKWQSKNLVVMHSLNQMTLCGCVSNSAQYFQSE